MLKKLLALFLSLCMICGMLAACESPDTEEKEAALDE